MAILKKWMEPVIGRINIFCRICSHLKGKVNPYGIYVLNSSPFSTSKMEFEFLI